MRKFTISLLLCSYYRANEVQQFTHSRPVRKGEKDPDNEFAVSPLLLVSVGSGVCAVRRQFYTTFFFGDVLNTAVTVVFPSTCGFGGLLLKEKQMATLCIAVLI